jgi:hypothetical protein
MNNLNRYRTIDITELSGSPWSTAEKVLGLDENDRVVMAEPEEYVTPEYVQNAIDQAMQAETARTESTYATLAELDAKIAEELQRATQAETTLKNRIDGLFAVQHNTLYLNNE